MSTMTTGSFENTKDAISISESMLILFWSYARNHFNRNVIFAVLIVVIVVQAIKMKNYSKFVPFKKCIPY